MERDQLWLMPPSLADWLPSDHQAWFVLDVIAELDLSSFYRSLRADGRGGASYHTELILGVASLRLHVSGSGRVFVSRTDGHAIHDAGEDASDPSQWAERGGAAKVGAPQCDLHQAG